MALFVLTLLAACGSSGDGGTGGGNNGERVDNLYTVEPDVAACSPGELTEETQQNLIDYLNEVRTRHNLLPVSHDPSGDAMVQAAALIIVANLSSNHHPSTSSHCFTQEGLDGSVASNLFLSAGNQVGVIGDPARYINEWLIDRGSTLGHRRFLLDPFLKVTALGIVDGDPIVDFEFSPTVAAVLWVTSTDLQDISASGLEYVAYPFGDYPMDLVDKAEYLSFSVVAGTDNQFSSQDVDYSGATVNVTGPSGALTVHSIAFDNFAQGLANIIQWKVDGLQDGVEYTVEIDGVIVNDVARSYDYTFMLE